MEADRRKNARAATSLEVRIKNRASERAHIANLSIEGCWIETDMEVATGELLSFDLVLPTRKQMPLEGRVMYRRKDGFGLLFTPLNEEPRNIISLLIELELATSGLPRS